MIATVTVRDPMNRKDRLFESTVTEPGDFVFDQRVVSVFPDMINRSVPGYGTIVPMIGMLARRFAQDGTRLYDLGCSLGAVTLAMQKAVTAKNVDIIAVDNSRAMIDGLNAMLEGNDGGDLPPVNARHGDLLETEVKNASVVVLNFTLQFIAPEHRAGLLERIADGMVPGGILALSEKIRFEDPREQALQTEWHHDFKRAQGYSDLEIARKRDALEKVLIADSLPQHRKRLAEAGFDPVHTWFQGFNFVSLVAFR